MARWAGLLFLVAITALAIVGAATRSSSDTARAAPPLPGKILAGPPVSIASLHGRPALVNFWASWCDPCRKEAAELERYNGAHGRTAPLVGIDFTDNRDTARDFLEQYHWTFTTLSDPTGDTGRAYGVGGLPVTYALNADGRVVQTLRGPQTVASLTAAASAAAANR